MLRITVKAGANRDNVAARAEGELKEENGNPTRLTSQDFGRALQLEEWRAIDEIGQLSAIEFRKLNFDRVRQFVEEEKLGRDVADRLLSIAESEWNRLSNEAVAKDGILPPHRADWTGRCRRFAKVLTEKAKELLTADQVKKLDQALNFRIGLS